MLNQKRIDLMVETTVSLLESEDNKLTYKTDVEAKKVRTTQNPFGQSSSSNLLRPPPPRRRVRKADEMADADDEESAKRAKQESRLFSASSLRPN